MPLLLIAFGLAATQTVTFIVRPMTSYRLLAFGEGAASVGIVAAAFALGPLLLAVPLSRWTGGSRTALVAAAGALLMTAGCLGLAAMTTLVQAVLASIVLGLGHLAVMLALHVMTAQLAQGSHDRNFGVMSAGASAGQLIGPVVGTLVVDANSTARAGTRDAMIVAAAVSLATLTVIYLLSRFDRPERVASASGRPPRMRDIVTERGPMASIFVSLAVLAGIDMLTVYLPVLGEEQGIAPVTVGVLLAARAAASLASRLLVGLAVARTSRRFVLWTCCATAGILLAVLPWAGHLAALYAIMIVLGLVLGIGQPLTLSWLVNVVPAEAHSRALAIRIGGNRLGQVVVPALAGSVAGLGGVRAVFVLLSAVMTASTVVAAISTSADDP